MIESLFVMNEGGEVLIEKHYRTAHTRAVAETFVDHVKLAPRPEDTCPVIAARNVYLVHVFRYRLFFLAALSAEAAPMMVLEFLQRVVEVLFDYFGGAVNEAAVRDNFVTIYQILDEMLDNGCAPALPPPAPPSIPGPKYPPRRWLTRARGVGRRPAHHGGQHPAGDGQAQVHHHAHRGQDLGLGPGCVARLGGAAGGGALRRALAQGRRQVRQQRGAPP
eukprot:COSAG04_NODE_1200_length_7773_cov_5.364999_3_plen_220_part_00